VRGDEQAVFDGVRPLFDGRPAARRAENPQLRRSPPNAYALDREGVTGEPEGLALAGAAVVEAEGQVNEGRHRDRKNPMTGHAPTETKPIPTPRLSRPSNPIRR